MEDADQDGKEVLQDQAAEAELAPEPSLSRKEMTELESLIRGNLERYPDALLLTQVGSFYEVRKRNLLRSSGTALSTTLHAHSRTLSKQRRSPRLWGSN